MTVSSNLQNYLHSIVAEALTAGLRLSEDVDLSATTPHALYEIHLSACQLIVSQQPKISVTTIHELILVLYPLAPGWAPMYHVPGAPGTYLHARAWAPYTHQQAHCKPKRGVPMGRWQVATPAGPTDLLIMPGDRWAYLPKDSRVERPEDILRYL